MSASAVEWEPGDPLLVDQGCGTIGVVIWSPDRQAEARAEDTMPPPWYRPETAPGVFVGWNHHCEPCGVQWRGDNPCWNCGGEQIP